MDEIFELFYRYYSEQVIVLLPAETEYPVLFYLVKIKQCLKFPQCTAEVSLTCMDSITFSENFLIIPSTARLET